VLRDSAHCCNRESRSSCCVFLSTGALKRCYKCRSRGELGDCRNPFLSDEQALQPDSHVDAIPCSSGWCAKVVENAGDFNADEHGVATERLCLQQPPRDLKERCSLTLRGHQQVFMCFCRGDLCNGQSPLKVLPSTLLFCSTLISIAYFFM